MSKFTHSLVLSLIRRHWCLIGLAFLASLIVALFEGSTVGILAVALQVMGGDASQSLASELGKIGSIADQWSAHLTREKFFLLLVGLAVATQVLRSGIQVGGLVASAFLQSRISKELQSRIFGQMMNMGYGQISRYKTGNLFEYFGQAGQMASFTSHFNILILTLLIMGGYLVVMFWLSQPVMLISLGAFLLLSLLTPRITKSLRKISSKLVDASIRLSEQTIEFLQAPYLLRAFGREDYAINSFESAVDKAVRAHRKHLIRTSFIGSSIHALAAVIAAGILIGGYSLVGWGNRAVLLKLLPFLYVFYRIIPQLSLLNQTLANIARLTPSVNRVSEILNVTDKEYLKSGKIPFRGLRQGIEFQNVTMRYLLTEKPAVRNISLSIPAGSMAALVGESGSGKSTLLSLLLRLYDPTEGKILMDGIDLRGMDLKSWRQHIGLVNQDTFIFHATVRQNIAFGNLQATDAEIVQAAKAAHAHEFILELEKDYDTVVGDKGYRLSGGQKQRIAIARAILRNPDILLLDEATSDLDSYSEHLIQKAIEKLRKDRTVISVTHRLSTIATADKIGVLKNGCLSEGGTHSELLKQHGTYTKLWQMQYEPQHLSLSSQ